MLICVTNRKLCRESFLCRIERLAQARHYAVKLRENDMDLLEYEQLAWKVKAICDCYGVLLIIQQYRTVAENMRLTHLHLSMPALRTYQGEYSQLVGASVHSVAEAEEAQALGAAYLIAGHIYATDCKQGLPPKGLPFLRQVCQAVSVPVFAIGGIAGDNVQEIWESGAAGCCVMSAAMTCEEPKVLVPHLTRKTWTAPLPAVHE